MKLYALLCGYAAVAACTGTTSHAAPQAARLPMTIPNSTTFPTVRVAPEKRHFQSPAIEAAISEFQKNVADPELGWLFNNAFPNTLDTTVTLETANGRPSTYVITGDIDAMWLRDSSAQVWPYLPFAKRDPKLQQLIAGVIN